MTRDPAGTRSIVRPGALTALLGELARAPEATGWNVPAQPGERIGRFEIVRELGRGGFGVVYEARDTQLGRSVAFKAIRAGSTDAAREARALAEAEAAARLAHPNIVHLYDVGRCERGAFLIMELLRGETLDERLVQGLFPARAAVHVAAEIARGLGHAHEQGVVHRDLKPGNVFLCEDGQVKVLDFGLAHVFGRGGLDGGTPAYMAPEQERGEPSDERADVYALGVILHELVAGSRPFQDGAPGIPAGGKAPELPGAPPALARLAARMLARDPGERPASAADVHRELASIQRSMEPRRLLWAAWGVAALALATAGVLAMRAAPLPAGRLLVAFADADNQTGEAELDGVSELLQAGLEQSRRVSVMARSRIVNVLRERGGAAPRVVAEGHARAAALAARAQLLVVPTVHRAEGGYDVAVRGVDLSRDEPAFSLRERAGAKATVPEALERLVQRVRKSLQEDPKEAPADPVSVAQIASPSAEAMRLHALGKRLHSEGRFAEALDAYERALVADPDFPSPRMEILEYAARWVSTRAGLQEEGEVKKHVAALRKNLHRVPAKERAWFETYVLNWDGTVGNLTEEIALYDRAIEAWPEDPRPYVAAARQLLMQRADLEAARPYLEKAIALAPLEEGWAIDFLIALGRLDDALARARRWATESPIPLAHVNVSIAHRARGELAEAMEAARRSLRMQTPEQLRGLGMLRVFAVADALEEAEAIYATSGGPPPGWLALRGRVRDALAAYDADAPGRDAPIGERIDHAFSRSFILLPRGDPAAVWRQAEAVFRTGYGWFPCYAFQLAALGDMEHAAPLSIAGPTDHHVCLRMLLALRTWRDGNPDGALRAFSRIATPSSHLFAGEILSELGRDREAVEESRIYRRRLGLNNWDANFDAWNLPRSLYLEAAALERLGEKDEARRVIGRLLHLWARADPDLPLLPRAKALAARLDRPPAP